MRTVVSLVIMVVLIKVSSATHTDSRPFVVAPLLRPLFAHPADNGFPSGHTALAATVAVLVMMDHGWLGALLLAAIVVLGAALMTANVRHEQDIFAGLLTAAAGHRRYLVVGRLPLAAAIDRAGVGMRPRCPR